MNLFSIDYLWPVSASGHLLKIILSPEVVFTLQTLLQSNEHTLTFSCFPACCQMYKWVEEILNALSYQVQSQGNPDQGAQCHQQGEFSKELLVFQPYNQTLGQAIEKKTTKKMWNAHSESSRWGYKKRWMSNFPIITCVYVIPLLIIALHFVILPFFNVSILWC